MFISGGVSILLAIILLTIIGFLIFSRGRAWFGRLPGDIRHEGQRTRVYAPVASMLLLSLVLSLVLYLLGAIF